MIRQLVWLIALFVCTAAPASGQDGTGLKAVKADSKRKSSGKRRTLQEWRAEQHRKRAEQARSKPADPEVTPEPPTEPEQTEPTPPSEDTPPAATQASKEAAKAKRKRKKAKRLRDEEDKSWVQRYLRELEGLLALLTLWLITRIYGQTSQKNARQPPKRPSPVTAEELGRILFGIGRAQDGEAYRGLFLNGAEAMQVLGADQANTYISERSHSELEAACERLSRQLPSGTSYLKTEVTPTHVCVLHIAQPDGTGQTLTVGSVAKVGAVLRLVRPAEAPHG